MACLKDSKNLLSLLPRVCPSLSKTHREILMHLNVQGHEPQPKK
jgi:hypothetical protein